MNKPEGSKLIKFKEWVTLPVAAKYLSGVYNEEVTAADILKWALDGYLKLSVYFENTAYATPGYLEKDTLPEMLLEKEPVTEEDLKLIELISKICSEYNFVESEKERVVPLDEGVFDLPMIGAEWNYIEGIWQGLIGGGPKEIHKSLEQVIVEDCKGNVYALKEVFDDNEHLLSGYNSPLEEGKDWFEMEAPRRNYANYYPAWRLPEDSVLVVRTDALREFEQFIADNSVTQTNSNKSDLSETELNTIVDTYAQRKDSFDNWHKKSGANIEALTVESIFGQVKQTDKSLWNIGLTTFKRDFWQKYSAENNLKKPPGRRRQSRK